MIEPIAPYENKARLYLTTQERKTLREFGRNVEIAIKAGERTRQPGAGKRSPEKDANARQSRIDTYIIRWRKRHFPPLAPAESAQIIL